MAEAHRLAEAGYSEIQLLGQNVNKLSRSNAGGWNFATLLARVAEISGIRRVRYTTSHPRDFGRDIVDAMDSNPAICDHVHLPVQSGSSDVLARMDRLYTRDEYIERIGWLKNARRTYSITTDIIVGFPGETERTSRQRSPCSTKSNRFSLQLQVFRRGQTRPPSAWKTTYRTKRAAAPRDRAGEAARHPDRRNAGLIGSVKKCWWKAATRRWKQWIGRTSDNRTLNFTHPLDARPLSPESTCQFASHAPVPLLGGRERNCGVLSWEEGGMEVEMKIRGLMMDPVTNMPIVILRDVSGNSVLPIWSAFTRRTPSHSKSKKFPPRGL